MADPDQIDVLTEVPARAYLSDLGIPMVPATLVRNADELDTAIEAHGPDLVLKASGPWLLHKSDLGLVRVGVDAGTARTCYEELVGLATAHGSIDGILVEPRLVGVEMIVGVRRDPALGPFVLVGAGGTQVEVLGDVAVAPAPVAHDGALDLLAGLKASALLTGYRGADSFDVDALAALVSRVSRAAVEDPALMELDLNPVIVDRRGATAVDARLVRDRPRPPRPRRDRDLGRLFDPRSVAVIGASTNPNKLGARVVRYLADGGYRGTIVPIHPSAAAVHGVRAVPSLAAAGPIDLACVVVPPDSVRPVIESCAEAGIRHAIVHTSGFAEAAGGGGAMQTELVATAERVGVAICGPNSLGILSPGHSTYTSFAGALESSEILAGGIGLVSQSGAIASSLLSRSVDDGVGFSRWVSTGNEADLDLADFVSFLARDLDTRVIALFIEQVRDGAAFRASVREALERGKPVVAFKAGRSERGRQIARSHTGALAGDDRLYTAFLRDVGVVRVASLRDLLDAARFIVANPLATGRRLAVVTMSGGASSVIADLSAELDLLLPPPDADTTSALSGLLPSAATIANPLDVTAAAMVDPDILIAAVAQFLNGTFADIVLVQLTTNADPIAAEMAMGLVELQRRAGKPLIVSRLGSPALAPRAMEVYRSASIPVLTWPEDATRVAWAMAAVGEVMADVVPLPRRGSDT